MKMNMLIENISSSRRIKVMTTETLNISEEQLVDYSKAHNEPSWMTELRKKALKLTETLEMPKPDKTKLRKWNFDTFKQHYTTGIAYDNLSQLPEAVKQNYRC